MSKEQDGGPAFPSPMQDDRDCHARNESGYGGLSIRDWFAGRALPALINHNITASDLNASNAARHCYAYADAMLKARKQ